MPDPLPVCEDYYSVEHCIFTIPMGHDDPDEWMHQCSMCFGGDPCDDCTNPNHPEYMLLECCYPYGVDENLLENPCDEFYHTGEQCEDGSCQLVFTPYNDCTEYGLGITQENIDNYLECINAGDCTGTIEDFSDFVDDVVDWVDENIPWINLLEEQCWLAGGLLISGYCDLGEPNNGDGVVDNQGNEIHGNGGNGGNGGTGNNNIGMILIMAALIIGVG